MAELSTIARPYAEALFQVARTGDLKAWDQLVGDMAAVASNPDMLGAMTNPNLSPEQVLEIFRAALGQDLDALAKNFVQTLGANGRLSILPEIAVQFHALKNAAQTSDDAMITTAYALDAAQLTDLVAALERRFKVKLTPHVTVDASLIGGVRVVVGDQVLDSSVRTRLDQMRVALTA
jgi:F-type H+-transporting ATPase subunit delta